MPDAPHPVRIWDLPTRLFHWLLAICVVGAVVSAKVGGNAMEWHFRLGYCVLALLAFRLLWGFAGGHWSRFARFVYSPATLWRYLRGRPTPGVLADVGHSPLGALSVWALFAVLAVQAGTGLVADDEIINTGPLVRFVSGAASSLATGWHKSYGQWLVLGLVGLHVAAVGYYAVVRRKTLIRPMISGDKHVLGDVPPSADTVRTRVLAMVLMAACAAAVAWVATLRGF